MKCIGKYPQEDVVYETMLSKFGSRLVLIPKPGEFKMGHGLTGFYYDKPVETTVAVCHQGAARCLPFSRKYKIFENMQQEIGLTYITYCCRSDALPFEVVYTISAPFYPQDVKLSVAPFFYITVSVRNLTDRKVNGSALIALENVFGQGLCGSGESRKAKSDLHRDGDYVGFDFEDSGVAGDRVLLMAHEDSVSCVAGDLKGSMYSDFSEKGRLDNSVDNRLLYSLHSGLCWSFDLKPGQEKQKLFIYAGYCPVDVLRTQDKQSKFLYTRHFENALDVLRYARQEYDVIRKKAEVFEDVLAQSSLPEDTKKLIVFAFQSYIANTWWTVNDEQWFTVWEGCCRFHSSVDVSYNIELFSLFFWPDLLKLQLETAARFKRGNYMTHDLGDDLHVFGQAYDHDMPVEESANYLLLLYAYWRFTEDEEFVERKYGLARTLLEYLLTTDRDGDGVPDELAAVKNTVDAGSATLEGSPGQTYLAVKSLAAYTAGKTLAEQYDDMKTAKKCDAEITKIRKTLADKSWLGNHFAICLDSTKAGFDGCSIYSCNGLLYLLLTNLDVPLPELFKQDIEFHLPRLARRFGWANSTVEGDNVSWVSQNTWRDLVGLYLGINTLQNASRYWSLQLMRNSWEGGAFTDAFNYGYQNHTNVDLDRYPRGLVTMGYLYAMGGISVDVKAETIKIAPPVSSFRLPLASCADWDGQVVPWVSLEQKGREMLFRITDFNRLNKIRRMQLRLPVLNNPSHIRLLSDKRFSISEMIGQELKFAEGLFVKLDEVAEGENERTVCMELIIEEASDLPNTLDVQCLF